MFTSIDTSFKSKKLDTVVFKLNSDDFHSIHIRKITKHIKSLGFAVTKTRTYSKEKLMSWANFKITTPQYVSWEQNHLLALEIVNTALFKN
jgi:hypothetical protein